MIIVTQEEIVLESSQLAVLDSFLRSVEGRRVVQAWAALRPPIIGDPHADGKAAGYEMAVVNLLSMVAPVKEEPSEDASTNYPDLDKDEEWINLEQKSVVSTE